MRENFVQTGTRAENSRNYIEGDWHTGGIPANVHTAEGVYIDTSYGFAGFHSLEPDALLVGEGSGCYDRASFLVGTQGKIRVGKYCILNGVTLVCQNRITVGDHCMLAWGSVLTDSWLDVQTMSLEDRRELLKRAKHRAV